jgi:hypothetical protein
MEEVIAIGDALNESMACLNDGYPEARVQTLEPLNSRVELNIELVYHKVIKKA